MNFKKPLFVINFKTYEQGTGKQALSLARACEKAQNTMKKQVVVCLQSSDVHFAKKCSVSVFAQHLDPIEPGAHTGFILPSALKKAGVRGTLLNHSEHKLPHDYLHRCISAAQKEKLIVIACADTPAEAKKIAAFSPDYIAIEPPKLIGGTVSVATANPEIITQTIKAVHSVKKIPVLCGAGIREKKDIKVALSLGCDGVLIASGVVLAKNPYKTLISLMK